MNMFVGGASSGGIGGQGGGHGGDGSGGGPCGACKFLRRKCVSECIFAPYFEQEHGAAHFAVVHRVFGASNVSKLLHQIPEDKRLDAVVTMCYEAQCRLHNPVYGCVSYILALREQIATLQSELNYVQNQLATTEQQQALVPPLPALPPMLMTVDGFSDINVDLSFLLDEEAPPQQQQQYVSMGAPSGGAGGSGAIGDTGNLDALAREPVRHGQKAGGPAPPPSGTYQ